MATSGSVWGNEKLQILYEDRPPYYVTENDDSVSGIVLTPVALALKKAGIDFEWVIRSSKRQIVEVKNNRRAICTPGWFKKPERELFAKFSDSVYQDKPQVILARVDNPHKDHHTKLEQLFSDKAHRIGVKLGFSYGTYIDQLLAKHQPTLIETSQNLDGMVRMLLGKRFDYMITTPEEYVVLKERLGKSSQLIAALSLNDIPPGNKRYLICSKKVDDEIINRFNAALKTDN